MRALVVRRSNDFAIEDVPRPTPGPNEVLCRVSVVTICGTDPNIIKGRYLGFWPQKFPLVPGHEWSGEVVELGPGAEVFGWQVGTRVAGTSHSPCGFCRRCVEGRYNLCEKFGDLRVHQQYGHNAAGAYAEYVVHSIRSVIAVPDWLSDEEAAMLDPLAIALHTVKLGGHAPGDTVTVVGPGVMGLMVAECARALGAGRVIMVGRGARLERAAGAGHETVDVTSADPVQIVRELTHGGTDVALECSGSPLALRQCVEMTRKGGRVAVIGLPSEEVGLDWQRVVLDEINIAGVRASAGEMPEAVALLANGRVQVSNLVTHRFGLEDFAAAYRTFTGREDGALKVVVNPRLGAGPAGADGVGHVRPVAQ